MPPASAAAAGAPSAPPHDPLAPFRAEAERALRAALDAMGLAGEPVRLARAPEGRGDLAFPCHPLAGKLRKAPPAIAAEFAERLPASDLLAWRVEGPFLNAHFAEAPLARAALDAVLTRAEAFGTLPPTGTKVIVEHTSANPTGPFHVGRARNPIIGDTLARVLRAAGNEVATEYYVNDMGKQVITLTWGARSLKPEDVAPPERPKADHELVAYYRRASALLETDAAAQAAVTSLLQRYERNDPEVGAQVRETVEHMLGGMQQSLDRLHVGVDRFAWESEHVFSGAVDAALQKLKAHARCREEEGALYLDLEGLGIAGKSQKFFLTRKDGTTLYTMRDVAYHLDKFRRADRVVDVLGEDHKLAAKQLTLALKLLGEERAPEVVFYAFVGLPEGQKMSTRKGTVVTMDDLLDEAAARAYEEVRKRRGDELGEDAMRRIAELVGVGAVRFNIASVQAEKAITFRWEEALDFEGASAPFVQYAHARAASILRKAAELGIPVPAGPAEAAAVRAELLAAPKEQALLRTLARMPGVVAECAAEAKVHPVAAYALEVANAFNQFYRDSPVLQAEPEDLRAARLALVRAGKQVLRNGLDLLGIEAPESM